MMNNTNKRNNRQFYPLYTAILNNLEKKHGKFSDSDKRSIVKKMLDVDFTKYNKITKNVLIESMTTVLSDELQIPELGQEQEQEQSMDQYMQNELRDDHTEEKQAIELDITKIFGINNLQDFKMLIEPSLLYKKAYLCFDSFNKKTAASTTTVFSWDYSSTRNENVGVVSSTRPIKNIVSIQLYQPLFPTPSSSFQVSNTQRVSILIEEFSTRAHITAGGQRYHWLTKINGAVQTWSPARHSILQIEEFNDGVVTFNPPVNIYSTLSLSFGDPNTRLTFYKDVMPATVSGYGATTTITTSEAHNIASTDLVYIEGFVSVSGFNDNTINTDFGHIATVTTSTAFTIPINTSTGSFTVSAPITVKLFRYRLILAMEVTYLDYDIEKRK